jgi:hypothetical protein
MNELKETWKDIEGYEGHYQVSNWGRIKSLKRKYNGCLIMKPYTFKNKYPTLPLSKNGKSKSHAIHRIVALHFVPNIKNKPEINHKDCNKTNNYANNLEWCTRKENKAHARKHKMVACGETSGNSKLTNQDVREIRTLKGILAYRKIARLYGVTYTTIFNIINKITWNHV